MLSPQHRRSIRSSLTPLLGEEETDALLSELPSKPGDEPATRDDLRLSVADLRTEIAGVRSDLRTEIADLRVEMHTEIADLRAEMHRGFSRVYAWGASALLGGLSLGMAAAALIARGG